MPVFHCFIVRMTLRINTLDRLIERLEYLIEPLNGNDKYDHHRPISERYMPRVLDLHMTSYLINLLQINRETFPFSAEIATQLIELAYEYVYARQHCTFQFLMQPRAIWRKHNGKAVCEVPLYDLKQRTEHWYINASKYFHYPYLSTVNVYPLVEENEAIHRQKVKNLDMIAVYDQRQSYLIHMMITGEREVLQKRYELPYLWEEGDPPRTVPVRSIRPRPLTSENSLRSSIIRF